MPDPFERCAPFQPSSCLCSELRLNTSSKVPLPACRPTVACGRAASKRSVFGAAGAAGNATIAILYGFQRERTRNSFTRAPLASYLKDMTLIMRLVLSLRAVDTALPIQLLVSGERHRRFEARLAARGVKIRGVSSPALPRWANAWHSGSFSKLAALGLLGYDRVIVLDVDCVVLRNIDHLAFAPAPGFVYRRKLREKCTSRAGLKWELSSGVMVLQPGATESNRMLRLMRQRAEQRHIVGDGGDQSIWRIFWSRVFELPAAYNAYKTDAVPSWRRVKGAESHDIFVLHDIWPVRWWAGWRAKAGAELFDQLRSLSRQAAGEWNMMEPRRVCYRKDVINVCEFEDQWQGEGMAMGEG
ncbi:hypothetical protein EMIHUDRAFT_195122 [Emiliania huxleyi CCMP1516]|uniref:Nucleotide-diphospho-sugar transferase domain-containing protein n=2 Tax=Emiliania huxleyi TaxID=2903 RepID=A0A0D3I7Z6_EMIH1|nr:hypothetical protein EMIHUDRAFT_249570 [Emiliania huxleyi CCMP1516]XP_005775192.1 hypothetical protein EMIHUDRAFT_195122 [Emiliania huxleyi CCMP1516]EOD07381.1 hypothetical protein EMIHUDRAFT_249570 [Emiliania huxleyi CCMP1516]EOD22763.1 hypothetical protein EMIHUDRAFT_195122 [Emiliania huxleyi CCMP1516]|eukprot:XP_005759810.1 hypothetical protein EMIHUDRAFT_249570 [Emiliania huxleyi CCMP1516]